MAACLSGVEQPFDLICLWAKLWLKTLNHLNERPSSFSYVTLEGKEGIKVDSSCSSQCMWKVCIVFWMFGLDFSVVQLQCNNVKTKRDHYWELLMSVFPSSHSFCLLCFSVFCLSITLLSNFLRVLLFYSCSRTKITSFDYPKQCCRKK